MEKFGSIEQFRNVIRSVKDYSERNSVPIPTLTFIGSVKLHGTNAGIVYHNQTKNFTFQSREREITIEDDNAGFAGWGSRRIDELKDIIKRINSIVACSSFYEKIAIFGEWCGKGVQSKVAISELPKMFVIFNITLIDSSGFRKELDVNQILNLMNFESDETIRCIYHFKTWTINIDFTQPEHVQNQLIAITTDVENRCPVGAAFGVDGIGEGVVYWNHQTNLKFKVKGEKHSPSKVKTIAAVDVEKMNSIAEFVSSVVTENRLNQGLDKLTELGLDVDIKNIGTFIKWVVQDVLKEESDVIAASEFEVKEITPKMSAVAKQFFMTLMTR